MRFIITLLLCIWAGEGLRTQTLLQYAVDFTATDSDGTTHTLFDYLDDDKHVMLSFLYTTCSPCTTAVEPLVQIYHDMGCNKGDLIVLAVNYNETNETVITYQEDNYFPIPYISGEDGGGNAIFFSYQIQTFPTVILIQPDGYILNQDIYPVTIPNLEHAVFEQAGLSPKYDVCPLPVVSQQEVADAKNLWELYPNPALDWVRVHAPNLIGISSSPIFLQLYNAQGMQVRYWLGTSAALNGITLELNGLPNGFYILSIQQDGRKPISMPLQIEH